ncbi:hypothetical protein ZEAMMB73_Zm00001d043395 [Zea mays]|uniref:Uncharacterized protein n=1 Tax=Zea mays TaxID=4577 RepID=A0A1D6NB38_MAIZE|nr:hypothetical protein ZEAMMB73_Zm00001d043395 [Zea mays]
MGEGSGNQRIDLGAPLRSARLADAPTQYKAGLNSGPLRHPGTVPFAWEQRPGQPKSVRTRRAAPPTPPRETSRARPGETGGSPYYDAVAELDLQALRGVADQGSRTAAASRKVVVGENELAVAVESTKDVKKHEALPAAAVLQKQDGIVEEEEERFSDALDTLSRTESFAMNCSVSGLSGALDPGHGAEPGSRGFMMDRFLPAAQAVAVGSPQYTFRKAGAAGGTGNSGSGHARAAAVKAGVGNGEDRMRRAPVQLPYQHLPPNYLSCAYPRHEEHEEEDEGDDDDDDYDVHSTRGFSAKGYAVMSPSSKPNGSSGTGDKDDKASRSNGSGSFGKDHDRTSLVGSDDSSFKRSSSMSSGPDGTVHEDSMDHHRDTDSDTCHLGVLVHTKAALDANIYDTQPGGRKTVGNNLIVKDQVNDPLTEKIAELREPTFPLDDGKDLQRNASHELPQHLEDNDVAKKEIIPLQSLLPLPVPKSPSESWLSRTLPSVTNRSPLPSFLGIQVHSKKQAPWVITQPKENDHKPSRPRQIRFADVVEKPTSLDSEI